MLTKKQIMRINELKNEGFSKEKAAKELKLSWATVNKHWDISVDTKENKKVESKTDGKIAAKAFEMFNEGKKPVDIVVELEECPETIEKYYFMWCKLKNISTHDIDEIIASIKIYGENNQSSCKNYYEEGGVCMCDAFTFQDLSRYGKFNAKKINGQEAFCPSPGFCSHCIFHEGSDE